MVLKEKWFQRVTTIVYAALKKSIYNRLKDERSTCPLNKTCSLTNQALRIACRHYIHWIITSSSKTHHLAAICHLTNIQDGGRGLNKKHLWFQWCTNASAPWLWPIIFPIDWSSLSQAGQMSDYFFVKGVQCPIIFLNQSDMRAPILARPSANVFALCVGRVC